MGNAWWTHTWNWQVGCCGCLANCWAEIFAARHAANPKAPARYHEPGILDANGRWTGKIVYDPEALQLAFSKMAETRRDSVFALGFMTDLMLGEYGALSDLANALLTADPRHVYVITTKQARKALDWQRRYFPAGLPSHVWTLLSVLNQPMADELIPTFLQLKGHKGIHAEPLLGALDIYPWLPETSGLDRALRARAALKAGHYPAPGNERILWCAAGPENGPHARPCELDWLRSLRDQAAAANVPFFLKTGLPLDGVEWQQTPWSPR